MNQGSLKQSLFLVNLAIHAGIILLSLNLSAQQIHWANPKPTGSTINDIEFWDDEHGLMIGNWGAVLTTTSKGQDWETLPPFTSGHLLSIHKLSGSNAIIASESSLFKTMDYGNTWELLFAMPDSIKLLPKSIDMLDEQNGYACSKERVFRTTDGGRNWSSEGINIPHSYYEILGCAFKDLDTGIYITGDYEDQLVYKTTTGGLYFELMSAGPQNYFGLVDEVQFLKDQTFLITGEIIISKKEHKKTRYSGGAGLLRSDDCGESWELVLEEFVSFKPKGLKIVNDSVFYYYGSCDGDCGGFQVITTHDGGYNWTVNVMPGFPYFYSPDVTAIYPFSEDKAIAFFSGYTAHNEVPYDYSLIQTQDGQNWYPVHQDFFDAFNNMLFMGNSMFLQTQDRMLESQDYFYSRDSIPFPGKDLQMAAKYGQQASVYAQEDTLSFLISTTNKGNSWQETQLDIDHFSLTDMEYAASDQLFLLGKENEEAKLFVNQPLQQELTEFQLPAAFSELNDFYIHSGEKTLFGADEAGQGSYYVFNEEEDGWDAYSLNLAPLRMGFASGNNSMYLVDKAKYPGIWESIRVPLYDPLPVFTAPDSGYIADVLIRSDGQLVTLFNQNYKIGHYDYLHISWFCTQLNNESWEMHGPYPLLDGLTLDPDGHHVWAFGSVQSDNALGESRLLYLGDGLPVGIEPIQSHAEQQAFSIEGNPFSNSLQISINLEFQGEAMLLLTDMNGKIVRQSKIMLHGRASRFLFQTQDLTPGAYVCSLVAGTERFNEKVVKK